MSEYQYYEFLAMDRPLSDQEMACLRDISSRGRITPSSFVNHYNWGDFKGNPSRLVEGCFDLFLYLANWGSRQLQIRIPERLLAADTAKPYCPDDPASMRKANGFVILDYSREEGDDENDDGQGWMASLSPLRMELMRGDRRPLYLGWLLAVQAETLDEEDREPPVPAGLGELTPAQRAFVDFMGIDRDLLDAAVAGHVSSPALPLTRAEIARGLRTLSGEKKDSILERLVAGDDPQVGMELLQHLEKLAGKQAAPSASDSRTVGELLALAESRRQERVRQETKRKAAERARQEQAKAQARARHLEQLAGREAEAWQKVDALIAARKPGEYDQAVALLVDLREVAVGSGRKGQFDHRLAAIRQEHARKPSFIERLDKAGLKGV